MEMEKEKMGAIRYLRIHCGTAIDAIGCLPGGLWRSGVRFQWKEVPVFVSHSCMDIRMSIDRKTIQACSCTIFA